MYDQFSLSVSALAPAASELPQFPVNGASPFVHLHRERLGDRRIAAASDGRF